MILQHTAFNKMIEIKELIELKKHAIDNKSDDEKRREAFFPHFSIFFLAFFLSLILASAMAYISPDNNQRMALLPFFLIFSCTSLCFLPYSFKNRKHRPKGILIYFKYLNKNGSDYEFFNADAIKEIQSLNEEFKNLKIKLLNKESLGLIYKNKNNWSDIKEHTFHEMIDMLPDQQSLDQKIQNKLNLNVLSNT